MIASFATSRLRKASLVVAAIAGAAVALFALLFLVVNGTWVPVYIPAFPWSPETSAAAFEARLFAVVLVSFLAGVAATSFLWWVLTSDGRRRARADAARVGALESELDRLGKLVASTMDKR